MKELEKARKYEATHPGVDIPIEQKAERYDRVAIKSKYAGRIQQRGRAIVGSMTVPDGNFWCECGKLRHSGDCK